MVKNMEVYMYTLIAIQTSPSNFVQCIELAFLKIITFLLEWKMYDNDSTVTMIWYGSYNVGFWPKYWGLVRFFCLWDTAHFIFWVMAYRSYSMRTIISRKLKFSKADTVFNPISKHALTCTLWSVLKHKNSKYKHFL